MKIICDSCNAKYSIADEKVKGKVFKIRCKKCSNIIVVRGSKDRAASSAPVEKETQVYDYQEPSAEGEWHIVLNDQQVGPMTAAAVRERFNAGDIADDTFVWKDGMGDWEPLGVVSEFADLSSDNEKTVANVSIDDIHAESVKDEGLSQESSFEEHSNQDDPDDLFSQNAGLPSASQDETAAAAMFGSSGSEGNDIFDGMSEADESDKKLIGQRSDNSVLFSLSDLAQGENASAQNAAELAEPSQNGVTEGSGLIDIRSMAQMYLGDQDNANADSGVGSEDDLPVFNQTGFDHAAPVLIPSEPKEDQKRLHLLYGAVGLLSLLFLGLLAYTFLGKKDGDETQVAQDTNTIEQTIDNDEAKVDDVIKEKKENQKDVAEMAKEEEPDSQDDDSIKEPDVEAPQTAVKETPKRTNKNTANQKKKDSKKSNKKSVAKTPEPKNDPVKSATSQGGCDEISCLVTPGKACCKKYNKKSGSSSSKSSSSSLPVQLSKSDVTKGISRIRGKVKACGDKHKGKGTVFAKMKIAGSGRVSSVNTSGGSSTLQRCVASAVKKASFRKTQKGMSVKYPFSFK